MKANKKAVAKAQAAKANGATGKTTEAVTLTLDFKSNHRIRQRAADALKVDLFALHAMKKGSKGYVTLCMESAAKVIDATKGKEATHVLCVGAVANTVTMSTDGFYSRSHGKGALVGNVDALIKLYGEKSVSLFTVGEMSTRYAAIKEEVTRRIGGKSGHTRVGREFVSDGDRFAMFGKLDNGKIVIYNGEFSTNAHNYGVRASTVKTTSAKGEKVASTEQKDAEKLAAKG